jgi:gliding motility-associated-like protein
MMDIIRAFYTIGLLMLCTCVVRGQNLLLNGDFEQYDACPGTINADFCTNWQQIELSNTMNQTTAPACVYFNLCAGNFNHPYFNNFGYQMPHSGEGFVSVNVGAFYQELTQPLIADRFYTLSLFVNIPNNRACVLNQYSRIGLYATATRMADIYPSDTGVNHTFTQFPGIAPTVLSNGVINDTTNWVPVSGCFRARGDERFITVAMSYFDEHQSCPMIYNFLYFVDDVSLTLNPNPDTIQVETTICEDTKKVLAVTQSITDIVGTAIHCYWQDGATEGCERTIQKPGLYLATIYTNCESKSVQFDVTEEICDCQFYAPNVIKVNKSGVNDTFQPYFACKNASIEQYQLRIFDRWGNQVFFSSDTTQSWDGRFGGQIVDGIVTWMINYELSASSISSQKRYTGDLLILR